MRRRIVLPLAQADARAIVLRSREVFGARAARAYAALLARAYDMLRQNPERPGVQTRERIPAGVCLFHLRHARAHGQTPKQPRHFIVFMHDAQTLTILRVLHDSMDVEAGVSGDTEE